ncbi:hypothetical protein OG280_40800 (plasmid) [Streptomyces virginiae]|uniref:hypothetical protein n=1 Tax=Streptomyces virginiae TaxID=1961 RepID=UPI002DD9ADCB|nr:hypothetical protein [Streptomyces virginiae]WSC82764.1 hypothetical protein OHA56_40915 [Streptomyces virginiae]
MPTFGKVATCTSPAVWMVEGYSGTGGTASLDRTVYACQRHQVTAEAQWLRGLIPESRPASGLHWCGTFTDYDPEASG